MKVQRFEKVCEDFVGARVQETLLQQWIAEQCLNGGTASFYETGKNVFFCCGRHTLSSQIVLAVPFLCSPDFSPLNPQPVNPRKPPSYALLFAHSPSSSLFFSIPLPSLFPAANSLPVPSLKPAAFLSFPFAVFSFP